MIVAAEALDEAVRFTISNKLDYTILTINIAENIVDIHETVGLARISISSRD